MPRIRDSSSKAGLPLLLNSPRVPLGIVAAAYLLFTAVRLATHEFDPSCFVTAGDHFSNPKLVPKNLRVLKDMYGYDGQFYYRLALDPFTSKQTDFGVTIDNPPYRHQRIVYPLIVWALSLGGRHDLVPTMMILTNYTALCAMGWIGGLYARSMGQHALWGVVFPLYPGLLLSYTRDLAEILAVFFLLTSLWLIRRERHPSATILLALAVLTKETTLLVAVGAFFVWLAGKAGRRENSNKPKWYFFLIPAVFYSAWQLLLLHRWGQLPLSASSGAGLVGLPFVGLVNFLLHTLTFMTLRQTLYTTIRQALWFTELCLIAAFTISVVCTLRSTAAYACEKLSWLLYAALAVLLSRSVWIDDWGFLRALSEFYVLGSIVLIGSRVWVRMPIFGCATVLWLLMLAARAHRV